MKIKSCVITGGLGLVGRHFLNEVKSKKKIKFIILEKKKQILRNKNFIKSFSKNFKFIPVDLIKQKNLSKYFQNSDCVLHLAAMLGVENTESNVKKCWDTNFVLTNKIIAVCDKLKINRLIFTSSSEVYGEANKKKIDEKSPLLGKNIYAVSKIASENLIKDYSVSNKKFKYTIFRLFNTYGEGQVAQFFLSKLCYFVKNKKTFYLNGNGKQTRSYCHASDVAKFLEMSFDSTKCLNQIINIGNHQNKYSLLGVVKLLKKQTKSKINIKFDKDFIKNDRSIKREIFNRICDTKKSYNIFKYKANVSLKNGLLLMMSSKIRKNW